MALFTVDEMIEALNKYKQANSGSDTLMFACDDDCPMNVDVNAIVGYTPIKEGLPCNCMIHLVTIGRIKA